MIEKTMRANLYLNLILDEPLHFKNCTIIQQEGADV